MPLVDSNARNDPDSIDASAVRLSPYAAVVLFLSIVFQHFQIVAFFKYPLTLGALSGFALLLTLVRPLPWARLNTALAVEAVVVVLAAWWDPRHTDVIQFARTGALLLGATVFLACATALRSRASVGNPIARVLFLCLFAVVAVSIAQVALGLAGSDLLFNPFRNHQYLYQYEPWLGYGIPRAQAFYLEPSYAALVITFIGSALLALSYKRAVSLGLTAAGVLACQSATGLIVLVIILLALVFGDRRRAGFGPLLVTGLLLLSSGSYLVTRLGSASAADSSANYRMVAPLEILWATLREAPFGRPLGSVATFTSQANLQNGTNSGVTIDNGYFLLVFYFGWVGLFCCVLLLVWAVRLSLQKRTNRSGALPLLIWLVFCPVFNGGVFLPEFAMMIWLALSLLLTLRSETDGDS